MKTYNNILKIIFVILIFLSVPRLVRAQRVSVSTNALTWVNLGTINAEGSLSVSKHMTVFAGAKYNPWNIRTKSKQAFYNQQTTGYAGVKYWPWHVYSGWWFGVKTQYMDFEEYGIFTEGLIRGNALGAGISMGYSFMVTSKFNIDLGIGGWGGRIFDYERYFNIYDKEPLVSGPKNFVFVDNLIIAVAYIF